MTADATRTGDETRATDTPDGSRSTGATRTGDGPVDVVAPAGSSTTAGPAGPVGVARDGRFWAWTALGLVVVLGLAALTRYLEQNVPGWAEGTAAEDIGAAIEYPVYAILLGLLGNVAVTQLGWRDRIAAAFRTEFFIKTGLVLLGASINLAVIASAAGPAIAQAILLISGVFLFT
ncbi:hypothetical protein [Micromonospora sp. NPDC048839]|uniref:hypothetical protein n=1 Tax=Micromonospora sp. NPDC048839 TaxID=3155641 RepID=UPI00340C22E1